nr:VENN motif pre-toxin domain-containing protein [Acinetobacter silvestris]
MAITGALGGQTDIQVVANTLAPYAAYKIGKEFGHGEDKNTTAQLVSHAILGATLAYVNGGNLAAGGSAAVASEAAATYFTNQYKDDKRYQNEKGEFIPNLLPEDVKTQIRDLITAIGAVAGGTVGDSAFSAQLAGVVGQNAAENNEMSLPFPVNTERGQGLQSIVEYGNKNGWNNKQIKEAVAKESRGRDFQGEQYTKALVYGSAALGMGVAAPEIMGLSALGGGVIGGGTSALTYANTTPKNEFSYKKLTIYTGGGAVTGVAAGVTKNPLLILGSGAAGAYATQYVAEGKANLSSAIISGGFGVLGGKLGSLGCGTACQFIMTYPTSVAATTITDKSIEKMDKAKNERK